MTINPSPRMYGTPLPVFSSLGSCLTCLTKYTATSSWKSSASHVVKFSSAFVPLLSIKTWVSHRPLPLQACILRHTNTCVCTYVLPQNSESWEINFPTLIFFFNWSIVDLQCCVSFRCTAKWVSYICIFFFRFFSTIGYYKILNMVPCAIQ